MNNLPDGFEFKDLFEHANGAKMSELLESANKRLNKTKNKSQTGGNIIIYLLAFLFICSLIVPFTVYFIWSFAFVAVQLWNWFIIPFFHVGPVTLLQMAGIGCFVRLFTFSIPNTGDKDKPLSQTIAELFGYLMMPWVALLCGYIIYRMM